MMGLLVAGALWAIYLLTGLALVKWVLVAWLVVCIVAWLMPPPRFPYR